MASPFSRLMIAGTGGDSGKTILSLGLLAHWRQAGLELQAFKKGPDFIDAAWLGWATNSPGRNLDTFMMGPEAVLCSFRTHATATGINVIEGNRGLLDGVDASGTHSSASLAKLLGCPVVLALSPVKVTATAAATVLGCRRLAPDMQIGGVILNRVRGDRHEKVVRQAIEEHAGLPVLGALPRLEGPLLISRHLGLVPPAEHDPAEQLRKKLGKLVAENLDTDRLLALARSAGPMEGLRRQPPDGDAPGRKVRIGYFRDSAFTFYYPENLEALAEAGAELVAISALADRKLPEIDSLYIGGGFPETHTEELAANESLLAAVRGAAAAGLPVYAECGGLIYLAESLRWKGRTVPLAGVLPIEVQMHDRPQGHGYCRMTVDRANPFLPVGTELKGHEFHYSSVVEGLDAVETAYAVTKGRGCAGQRDGLVLKNVLASYLHVHAVGVTEWASGLVKAARTYKDRRSGDDKPRSTAA